MNLRRYVRNGKIKWTEKYFYYMKNITDILFFKKRNVKSVIMD